MNNGNGVSNQESIEHKMLSMIDTFRIKFDELTSDEQKKEQMINSLKKPCQLFILSSPHNNLHLLIKTHLEEFPDKQIMLYPLKLESYLKKLENFVNDPRWEKLNNGVTNVPNNINFKNNLENIIINFGRRISGGEDTYPPSSIRSQSLLDNKLATWGIVGNMLEINYEKYITDQIDGYKRDYERDKNQHTKQIKEILPNENKGFITFFDPPIIIGEFKPTLIQKINREEHTILSKNEITKKFLDEVIIITKGGMIGIENDDKDLAKKIFNTIMSVALIFDVPADILNSSDLAETAFDNKTHNVNSYSWSDSRRLDSNLHFKNMNQLHTLHRTTISFETIMKIIDAAEIIIKNEEHVEYLKLLLSSNTQLNGGYNAQSFITSWIIIERDIYRMWVEKINSARVGRRIREDLERWDVHKVLEILHVDKIISNDDYVELNQLQRLRNDVIHEGEEVTQKRATTCFNLARDVIKNVTNLKNLS